MGTKSRLLILNEEKYNMKTNFLKYAVCFISVLGLVACNKDGGMSFSTDPLKVDKYVGQDWTVTAKSFGVTSADGDTLENVMWSSSNDFIVEVDSMGKALAKHVGEAKIYAAFENGMVLYSNASIHGRSNLILEPQITDGLSVDSIIAAEISGGKKIVRGGADAGYVVFLEENQAYKANTDYTVYVFGEERYALVNIKTDQAFREYNEIFLPERYNNENGKFVKRTIDNIAVQTLGAGESLVNVGMYSDMANADKSKIDAAYREVSRDYLVQLTDTSVYKKDALGLRYDVIFAKSGTLLYDTVAVNKVLKEGTAVINSLNSIVEIEDTLPTFKSKFELVFVQGAQKCGVDICHSKLKADYKEEMYYPAGWNYIAELDVTAEAAFSVTTTFAELDAAIHKEQAKYSKVVTKEKADAEVVKFDESFVSKYQKEMYSDENWNEVMRIHDETVQAIKDCKMESEISKAKSNGNKALSKVPKL
jgi:hypothetical protein